MASELVKIYQLKIQLTGVRPPIWRRILVSNSSTLNELHHTIQASMGWENSHLHQFSCRGTRYGIVDPDFGMDWDDEMRDELDFKVKDILQIQGDSIIYEYDFGDSWEHNITLEKITPHESGQFLPFCLKGKRGCPPEDVGGRWGYDDFLVKWNDKNDPEHEEVHEWVGDYFDPEEFNHRDTNKILREIFGSAQEV